MRIGISNNVSSNIVIVGEDFGTNHSISFDGSNDEIDFTSGELQTALNASSTNFKISGSVSVWVRINTTSANGQVWDFAIDSANRLLRLKEAAISSRFRGRL